MTPSGRFDGSGKYGPAFDGVYAAIAVALRRTRGRMTKSQVAAVHRKVLAGEPLEGDQERNIADRLRQQLGEGGQ